MDMGPIWNISGLTGHGWDWETLCGTHLILVTWVPHVKPMWADYIGPMRNIHGEGESWLELGGHGPYTEYKWAKWALYENGKHWGPLFLIIWAPQLKPMKTMNPL